MIILLKIFVLWIRRIFITILSILILIYSISFIIEKPDIGQGHYITMYDKNEEKFYSSNKQSNDVSLQEVSPDFLASIIAVEDHRFYLHRGFDPIGILRAIKNNIITMSTKEGASTITQQYARLLYLNNERTWSRKIKEAFLTVRLESHYNKDDILEGYVNTVYFGHGIYGIKNASHYYFDKEPNELDLNEASMLAGVINGPVYFSPFNDLNRAKERQEKVLNELVEINYIDEKTKEKTLHTKFLLNEDPKATANTSYQYYKDTVLQELKELGFYKENYINQGLNIYTTLDTNIQQELNKTVNEAMKNETELEISYMITDTHKAGILAIIGGKDYTASQFNRATSAKRQVASTIKPILYYLALESGFSANTKFKSEPTTFKLTGGQEYTPSNFSNKYANDEITMAQAIAVSDNIYAVKTHLFLGEQSLVNLLSKFNFKHVSPHPSLALGTLNSNIYELSNIYTTIANKGIYNKLHTIEKITNHDGEILYERKEENIRKLSEDSCLILSQLLTSPFNDIFKTYASPTMINYKPKYTYAAKSGTSDYDSLCIGYNPDYVLSGWVGYDDNHELTSSLSKRTPKEVFLHMANYLTQKETWYSLNNNIQAVPINPITGEYYDNGSIYWFKK